MSWLSVLAIIGGLIALGVFMGVLTMYKFVGEDPRVHGDAGERTRAH